MASDVVIIKKDGVYAKVTCERHVAMELSQFFTFFVPGFQFVPAFRNRFGTVRYGYSIYKHNKSILV